MSDGESPCKGIDRSDTEIGIAGLGIVVDIDAEDMLWWGWGVLDDLHGESFA